jgi:FKBP-type peptidyl-prolyl cis-trans isomerase
VTIGNVKANKGPVEGWSFALRGMCEGADRTFSVGPSRGYGTKGWSSGLHAVPPNATLFYHVSIVKMLHVRQVDITGTVQHGKRTLPQPKHNWGKAPQLPRGKPDGTTFSYKKAKKKKTAQAQRSHTFAPCDSACVAKHQAAKKKAQTKKARQHVHAASALAAAMRKKFDARKKHTP